LIRVADGATKLVVEDVGFSPRAIATEPSTGKIWAYAIEPSVNGALIDPYMGYSSILLDAFGRPQLIGAAFGDDSTGWFLGTEVEPATVWALAQGADTMSFRLDLTGTVADTGDILAFGDTLLAFTSPNIVSAVNLATDISANITIEGIPADLAITGAAQVGSNVYVTTLADNATTTTLWTLDVGTTEVIANDANTHVIESIVLDLARVFAYSNECESLLDQIDG
jgi:hypothetical protein